jgi:hypothetical protein
VFASHALVPRSIAASMRSRRGISNESVLASAMHNDATALMSWKRRHRSFAISTSAATVSHPAQSPAVAARLLLARRSSAMLVSPVTSWLPFKACSRASSMRTMCAPVESTHAATCRRVSRASRQWSRRFRAAVAVAASSFAPPASPRMSNQDTRAGVLAQALG